jgi:hypothetical protein
MPISRQVLAVTLSLSLMLTPFLVQAQDSSVTTATPDKHTAPTTNAQPSPEQLKSLVAPIALYPDNLVAQILAASTHPTQVVEAERWLQQNKNLTSEQIASAVDKEKWDPSVKGLTQFPSVLSNMNDNLSWTSSLGDAYYNVPNDVMAAIQALRKSAEQAGNLKSTPQQTVATEGNTIVIQPANPQVVYVPTYSPAIYGAYVPPVYPGYSGWDMAAASAISFGAGLAVGAAFDHPWGWGAWNTNWHGGTVVYNHNTYISNSNTFANRSTQYSQFNRANVNTANINRANINTANINRANVDRSSMNRSESWSGSGDRFKSGGYSGQDWRSSSEGRGFAGEEHSWSGAHSGSFGGFDQGGFAHADSFRGQSSFGGDRFGGGGFRGGGGFHGGGRR